MKSVTHAIPVLILTTIMLSLCGCADQSKDKSSIGSPMNSIAETYVKLVLAVGQHDPDYVDAYHGPAEWRPAADAEKKPLQEIKAEAQSILVELNSLGSTSMMDEEMTLRHQYLMKQIASMIARVEMLGGKKFSFDEESTALYDAVAPTYSVDHFRQIISRLEGMVPGKGNIQKRLDEYRKQFIIPKAKLDAVFTAAINECRARTKQHMTLPADESFVVEYVNNKSWSAYNWYKGKSHSLIQVNTDLPIYIDRAIDLAAHEGYPGHHVYNVLLEENLLNKKGWVEFSVYPLFSPQSLIAEGSANYGTEVAFTPEERLTFEKGTLFPLAGLDPSKAEGYYRVLSLLNELSYAGNEAARGYLNGTMSRDEAVQWLVDYALTPKERAEQRTRFFDQYRSYVINYNLGQDLVKRYIESRGGTSADPEKRWTEFTALLSSPRLPSGLR